MWADDSPRPPITHGNEPRCWPCRSRTPQGRDDVPIKERIVAGPRRPLPLARCPCHSLNAPADHPSHSLDASANAWHSLSVLANSCHSMVAPADPFLLLAFPADPCHLLTASTNDPCHQMAAPADPSLPGRLY